MPTDQPDTPDRLDLEARVRELVDDIETGGDGDAATAPPEPGASRADASRTAD